ncbi:olfactory receptor 8G50-like [Thomomys bottae]
MPQGDLAPGNHSPATEFILAGLTERPGLRLPLLLLFLGVYVATVLGNLGLMALIRLSSPLHTPMYSFLSSLSFIDVCQSTVIVPRMLAGLVGENAISYPQCMAQLYFFLVFAIAECHMLAAMAYDRYAAICHPLLYNVTMSPRVCACMVAGVYGVGLIGATAHTVCMLRLDFCRADIINQFFCDLFPLLELSCSSIFINEMIVLCLSAFNIFVPALTILGSYLLILLSILRLRSAAGRAKAFSTCGSHLSAVLVFFGSLAFVYLQPSSVSRKEQGKLSSVLYTTVVPMVNPLIYSLRNQDVKMALKKFLAKRMST